MPGRPLAVKIHGGNTGPVKERNPLGRPGYVDSYNPAAR
jgi:hypothetical protein